MDKRIIVVGLGNMLLKDEGLGVHVIKKLTEQNLPENVELIDGGVAGLDTLTSIKEASKLIIIDAIKAGNPPATLYRLRPENLTSIAHQNILSLHQIGITEILEIGRKTGQLPEQVIIIGVEPKDIEWHLGLSSEIEEKIPQIIKLVLKEINLLEEARG